MATRHAWLQSLLQRLQLAYSICIGMNSYRYDYTRCCYTQTRLTRWAALLVNAFTLAVLPWVMRDALHLHEGIASNRATCYANWLNVSVRGAVIAYTVLYRCRRERATYLDDLPLNARVEARLRRLLYAKYAALLYLMLAAPVCFASSARQWPWYSYALMFLFAHIVNIIYCTMFSYFLLMWHVCRGLCRINVQLRHLRQRLQDQQQQQQQQQLAQLHRDLLQLLRTHWQLTRLLRELNGIYCPQMLAMRINYFVSSVMLVFYGIVYSLSAHEDAFVMGGGSFAFVVMTLDFYMLDRVCDMLAASFDEAALVLREFNTLPLRSKRISILLEQLALQLSCCKMRVPLCGLFEVDLRLWFQMCAGVVGSTIVLVQFYLMLSYNPSFQSPAAY